ncbi:MAG: hypothetical protein IJ508_03890 [Oscillospiraceae bacterium]|nr:hypothetical protein [Oscillospiraceae bacterium]
MEWQVVLVLAELIGLFVLVAKPILKLNSTMVEFTTELKALSKRVDRVELSKHEAHERLWEHNDQQDERIADHETRIRVLEHNE